MSLVVERGIAAQPENLPQGLTDIVEVEIDGGEQHFELLRIMPSNTRTSVFNQLETIADEEKGSPAHHTQPDRIFYLKSSDPTETPSAKFIYHKGDVSEDQVKKLEEQYGLPVLAHNHPFVPEDSPISPQSPLQKRA